MPNVVRDHIIEVVAFYNADILVVGDAIQIASNGETKTFNFRYKVGYPVATAFSVAWFSDSARTIPVSGPTSPVFSPAAPVVTTSIDLLDIVEDAERWKDATLTVVAPTVAAGGTEETPEYVEYYGRITVRQSNFDRRTGTVL